MGSKIYADSRKRLLINDQVEDPKLHSLMTSNSAEVSTSPLLRRSSN